MALGPCILSYLEYFDVQDMLGKPGFFVTVIGKFESASTTQHRSVGLTEFRFDDRALDRPRDARC